MNINCFDMMFSGHVAVSICCAFVTVQSPVVPKLYKITCATCAVVSIIVNITCGDHFTVDIVVGICVAVMACALLRDRLWRSYGTARRGKMSLFGDGTRLQCDDPFDVVVDDRGVVVRTPFISIPPDSEHPHPN